MIVTEIKTQSDLDKLFGSISETFANIRWQRWLDGALRTLETEHRAYFDAQRAPGGDPWAPLSPATIRAKGHDRILFRTGRLRGSLSDAAHGDGVRSTWDEKGQAGLLFGTDVPYSIHHERGRKNMPARPHIGLEERPFDRMAESAVDYAFAELKQ